MPLELLLLFKFVLETRLAANVAAESAKFMNVNALIPDDDSFSQFSEFFGCKKEYLNLFLFSFDL